MKMCQKCGKMLDDNVQVCPICNTRVKSSGNTQSSNNNHHNYYYNYNYNYNNNRQAYPAQNNYQQQVSKSNNITDKAVVHQTNNTKKQSKKPLVIALAVASAAAVIAITVIGLGLFKGSKKESDVQKTDGQSYETVNSRLSEILSDSGLQGDNEKLKNQISNVLDELSGKGMVSDVKYVDRTGLFEFAYDDGTLGGIMLEPFNNETKGIQKKYANKDSNGKVVSYDNKVDIDKSKYTYSKNPKAKIMYGLGMPKTLSDMKKRSEVWKNEGLSVDIDEYCTVKDFANDLKGYDYIEIDEHGYVYDNVPVICLDEDITAENYKEYSDDLKKNNIIAMHYNDINNRAQQKYWIKPSFFKEHYGNKSLSGSIIYLGCCYGYKKDDLVKAIGSAGADAVLGYNESVYADYDYYIQDTFVYSLMCGDTVSEALKYSKDTWEKNDAVWYKLYYGRNKTEDGPAELSLYGDKNKKLVELKSTETQTPQKPQDEKPVPDIIKKMLETTDPDYKGQPGGPAAAFMTYYGYRGHEGTQQDVMWFQDMDGDNVPDLVVGGYSTAVDGIQGRVHCFEIQLSNGNGGDIVHLLLDNSSKSKHGHEAFMMQAYKDKNGSLMFTHTQFYAYTSPDPQRDPNYAGAFTIYEYSFANRKGDKDKKQILYYTYDPRNGSSESAFSCTDGSGKKITASAAKQLYNSYYSSKTPLAANVKTINYQKYMREMTQQQRKQALMDSYYAFSYNEDKTIRPYGKEVFDKMPSASEAKPSETTPAMESQEDMYADYASAVESFRSEHGEHVAGNISYFVCDIDSDNNPDLVVWDMQGYSVNRHVAVYKYDASSRQAKLYAKGEMGGMVSYCKKIKALVSCYAHGADSLTYPSGTIISITKGIIRNGSITDEGLVFGDFEEKKNEAAQYSGDVEQSDVSSRRVTASDIKTNAIKNKAA